MERKFWTDDEIRSLIDVVFRESDDDNGEKKQDIMSYISSRILPVDNVKFNVGNAPEERRKLYFHVFKRCLGYVDKGSVFGCLIGGAAGDALGYPVEFVSTGEIFAKYGKDGVKSYRLSRGEKALISDDTQMTLFTAEGLCYARENFGNPSLQNYIDEIYNAYKRWYLTQTGGYNGNEKTIAEDERLNVRRAPGGTCLSALGSGKMGSIEEPINTSKGCGGIMRAAPIAIVMAQNDGYSMEEAAYLGAQSAAITHGNQLGYIPTAAFVAIIYSLLRGNTPVGAVLAAKDVILKIFPDSKAAMTTAELMDKALYCAKADISDIDAVSSLGEGWVAEETLAIAIYSFVKYSGDFKKALSVAVSHGGDSDSTGAVTGNMIGAYVGINAIPDEFKKNLELYDVLENMSEKLFYDVKLSR